MFSTQYLYSELVVNAQYGLFGKGDPTFKRLQGLRVLRKLLPKLAWTLASCEVGMRFQRQARFFAKARVHGTFTH